MLYNRICIGKISIESVVYLQSVIDLFSNMRIRDIIDILIVAAVMYKIYTLLKETRAEQLIKGIVVLVILTEVSKRVELYTIHYILSNTMTVGAIALLVVFQPELRRGLEYIGRTRFFSKSIIEIRGESVSKVVDELVEAVASLSRQKIGALIVLERKTGLNEVADTGTIIDGDVSSDLLINIFIPNTPLHDGAVIIKDDIIKAAACFLPLTDNTNISKELGTRHRAALGISERSDSLSIIVSEETGAISTAENGSISRYLDTKTLRQILNSTYNPNTQNQSFINRWRQKDEQEEDE